MTDQYVSEKFPTLKRPPRVYFIRIGKFIKIGFTTDLACGWEQISR